MDKNAIITLIKSNLAEIVPELGDGEIDAHESLMNLGVNSIDRAELFSLTLDTLELDLPLMTFATVRTIEELADIMHQHKNK